MVDSIISIRLDISLIVVNDKIKKDLGITNRDIYFLGLREIIRNEKLQKSTRKALEDRINNFKYRRDCKANSDFYYRIHLPKNTMRRILDSAYTSYKLIGEFNMDIINILIDDALKLYDMFSPNLKSVLSKEMQSLKSFRDEKYLMSYLRAEARKRGENLLVFKDVERKKDTHSKRPIRK